MRETIPMNLSIRRRVLLACCAVAAGVMTFWACSTPVKVGATVDFAGIGATLQYESGHLVADMKGPKGVCVKLTYVGADGADISTEVVELPAHRQLPPGAKRVDYDLVPCPEPNSAAPTPGAATATALPSLAHSSWRDVYSFPVSLGAGSLDGAVCRARVWCGANESAAAILRPILQAGPGVAVPPNVQILFFADVSPSLLGATLRVAAQQPIVTMSLDWNGTSAFADLATGVNAIPNSLPNGWNTVETFIGNASIDETIGVWNQASMSFATLPQVQPEHFSMRYQALAY